MSDDVRKGTVTTEAGPLVEMADATVCENDHNPPRWAVVEMCVLDTTSLDCLSYHCADCFVTGARDFATTLGDDEPTRYQIRAVKQPTPEQRMELEAADPWVADYTEIAAALAVHGRIPVPGRVFETLQVLLAEHQQYLDGFSHSQQLRDHFRVALSGLVTAAESGGFRRGAQGNVSGFDTLGLTAAVTIARDALQNPPEWDHKLRR